MNSQDKVSVHQLNDAGDHDHKCSHEKNNKDARVYNLNEASTVGDVAHNIPHIYASLENCQVDH